MTFPEYTELYFTNFGPVAFLDEEGGVASILDHDFIVAHAEEVLSEQAQQEEKLAAGS